MLRHGRREPVQLEEVEPDKRAGHFQHLDDPLGFVRLLTDFMRMTEPAKVDSGRWRELLRSGGGESAPSPVSSSAVPRRWSVKRAAGRGWTG